MKLRPFRMPMRLGEMGEVLVNPAANPAIPSGLPDLDRMTGGFERSAITSVCGPRGMGVSAFLRGIVLNAAPGLERGVLYVSLTDGRRIVLEHLMAMKSGMGVFEIRHERAAERRGELEKHWEEIAELPIWAGAYPIASSRQIVEVVAGMRPVDLVVVDGVQALADPIDQGMEVMGEAAAGSSRAWVLGSSMPPAPGPEPRPVITDVPEPVVSRSTVTLALHRPAYYSGRDLNSAEMIVLWNDLGPVGSFDLVWNPSIPAFGVVGAEPPSGG